MIGESEAPDTAVYLDHFASSPMLPEALSAMIEVLEHSGANPSGVHKRSRAARRSLDDARDELASVLGARGDEVVFTSGGTEANNLALFGLAAKSPGVLVISAIEHHSVLFPAEKLGARIAAARPDGRIDLDALTKLLDESVMLVSVMAVNNETGVVQPLHAVHELVRERAPHAVFHTDAVQAVSQTNVGELVAQADLVSLSGHKFGGPTGIGALIVRARARERLESILVGGPQERELRAGTENVAGAVAMAVAATVTAAHRDASLKKMAQLRDRLIDGLVGLSSCVVESVPRTLTVPASCHLRFAGISSEEMLFMLDELGVAASSGAACASGASEPSHVLLAMGWSEHDASEAVRFSLGASTTRADIDWAINAVHTALLRLAPREPSLETAR